MTEISVSGGRYINVPLHFDRIALERYSLLCVPEMTNLKFSGGIDLEEDVQGES